MGQMMSGSRSPARWTPFVGVALAVLTAGSLIVFSVIAQRTSLDGFSARGVTAQNPSTTASGAITLPAVTGGSATAGSDLVATTAPQPLSPTTLLEPAAGTITTQTTTPAAASADVVIAAPNGKRGPITFNDSPRAAYSYFGERPTVSFDADEKPGKGKTKAKAKKAKKAKKVKKAKKAKNEKDEKADRRGHRARGRNHRAHSRGRHGRPAKYNGSRESSSSPGRSPASPSPRPQPAVKPSKPKSPPPSHSNGNAYGKSKSRGRGHR